MFNSILVVCTGNICRSPLAAALLQEALPDVQVRSAGLVDMGQRPADPHAIRLASEHGLDLAGHRSQQLNSQLCQESDLILVMESDQRLRIAHSFPQALGKTQILTAWTNRQDIADPYRQSYKAFAHCYQQLANNCLAWSRQLNKATL
jgi:protein-tyrosine phosphatase